MFIFCTQKQILDGLLYSVQAHHLDQMVMLPAWLMHLMEHCLLLGVKVDTLTCGMEIQEHIVGQ